MGERQKLLDDWIAQIRAQNDWEPAHMKHLDDAVAALQRIVLGSSERPLVVLDLNGVLIDRVYDKQGSEPPDEHATRVGTFWVWKRPGLDELLEVLFRQYDVALWSSVAQWNVERLGKFALGEQYYERLTFVFNQTHCERVESEVPEKPLFLKNLSRVWAEFPQYDARNTRLIDDSDQKNRNNPPECHVNPGTWDRSRPEASAMDILDAINTSK